MLASFHSKRDKLTRRARPGVKKRNRLFSRLARFSVRGKIESIKQKPVNMTGLFFVRIRRRRRLRNPARGFSPFGRTRGLRWNPPGVCTEARRARFINRLFSRLAAAQYAAIKKNPSEMAGFLFVRIRRRGREPSPLVLDRGASPAGLAVGYEKPAMCARVVFGK